MNLCEEKHKEELVKGKRQTRHGGTALWKWADCEFEASLDHIAKGGWGGAIQETDGINL
jgi:hypothetical protein